jgi:hypothetical protein
MLQWVFSVLFSLVIFAIGVVVMFTTSLSVKEISSIIVGFIWGMIIPILSWGFRDKIKLGKFAKILHLHDPLLGSPSWIDKGRRRYEFRSQLPSLDSILSIKNLKRVDILSVSSYITTIEYIESINKALNRNVEFNFLILNPNAEQNVSIQEKIYPIGINLKQQLEQTLYALCKEKEKLHDDKKGQLVIHTYDDIIRNGIMIVYLDTDDNPWIKVEDYVAGSDPNSRSSQAVYENDDKDFFDYNLRYYNEISSKSKEYICESTTD